MIGWRCPRGRREAVWGLLQGRALQDLRPCSPPGNGARRLQQELIAARQECARSAPSSRPRAASAEKIAHPRGDGEPLREAFSALSSDALQRNNEAFLQLARASMGEFQQAATPDLEGRHKAIESLVQPLRESLTRVDSKLQEVEKGRVGRPGAARRADARAHQAQQMLQSETSRLSRALRSPNVRGQWGELQLRRVLENAGLVEGSHYELKESIQTDDGRLTPDAIVKLPGGKNVVVDAKVPSSATSTPRKPTTRRSATRSCGPRAAGQGSHHRGSRTRATGRTSSPRPTSW